MYEDLVRRLNAYSAECERHGGITAEAADAIEELTAITESYNRSMEAWADEAARAQPRWVSVEERLPSPEVEVLVFTRDRLIGVDKFFGTIFGQPTFSQRGAKRITHWMPLPEPPEDEK